MAIIDEGNWSFRDPGDDIPDGSVINGGNFSQTAPNTAILAGKSLVINGGNWTNVLIDPNWTINKGGFCSVEYCANLHSDWVDAGHLVAEVENCPHVVETIEIAGGSTVYMYEDSS